LSETREILLRMEKLLEKLVAQQVPEERHLYYKEGTVDVAAPVTLRVHEELKRNAPLLYIVNIGPGTLYVRPSSSEAHDEPYEVTLNPGEPHTLRDIYKLVLRTDVDDTGYRVTERYIFSNLFDIFRGRTIYGYVLTPEESYIWPYLIAYPGASAEGLAGNIEPIAAGATVQLIEAFSGLPYIQALAGEDYLLKEVYLSFNQPILFEILQTVAGIQVHTCVSYSPAYPPNPLTFWPIGWARSLLEDIDVASNTIIQITNLGAAAASGKVWVIGFKKVGRYIWL